MKDIYDCVFLNGFEMLILDLPNLYFSARDKPPKYRHTIFDGESIDR